MDQYTPISDNLCPAHKHVHRFWLGTIHLLLVYCKLHYSNITKNIFFPKKITKIKKEKEKDNSVIRDIGVGLVHYKNDE